MSVEPFFKVSHVRRDGGAHELTLYGYAAEGTALNIARELEESKYVQYVVVLQRHVTPREAPGASERVEWEIVREHTKGKPI